MLAICACVGLFFVSFFSFFVWVFRFAVGASSTFDCLIPFLYSFQVCALFVSTHLCGTIHSSASGLGSGSCKVGKSRGRGWFRCLLILYQFHCRVLFVDFPSRGRRRRPGLWEVVFCFHMGQENEKVLGSRKGQIHLGGRYRKPGFLVLPPALHLAS